MAQVIAFEEFQGKTHFILGLENYIRRFRRAISIYFLVNLVIALGNRIVKITREVPFQSESDLKKLLESSVNLRNTYQSIISKLHSIRRVHPYLFRDSLFKQLEKQQDHFDNLVENLQIALDPAIKEGIHSAITLLPKIQENSKPWSDSLAKM